MNTGRTSMPRFVYTTCLVGVVLTYGIWQFYGFGSLPALQQNVRRRNGPFQKIFVHLDLKGAPSKPSYLMTFFEQLKALGVDGVVMEYEDMFPYSGRLEEIRRQNSTYSKNCIKLIVNKANDLNLTLVPLVQTFGHLEYVLKRPSFKYLSELPPEMASSERDHNSICPSDPGSLELIEEIIRQIRDLHPFSNSIHIGADEVYHLMKDERCRKAVRNMGSPPNAHEIVKIRHIQNVASIAKKLGFQTIYAWNDMFDSTPVEALRSSNLGSLVTPVIWGYAEDVTKPGYFPEGMFERYSYVFPKVWFASAFKGADGIRQTFNNIYRYFTNHRSYVKLVNIFSDELEDRIDGIILTGWQRYNHHAPLCELLPISLPSLVFNYYYLNNIYARSSPLLDRSMGFLKCSFSNDIDIRMKKVENWPLLFSNCSYPGSDLYEPIMMQMRNASLGVTNLTKTETNDLKSLLSNRLSNYFYDVDVEEFLIQNFPIKQISR